MKEVWTKWKTSIEWYFIGQNTDVLYPEIGADPVAASYL